MARGRKSSVHIVLSRTARDTLERWQRSTTMVAGLARRGSIILLLADGLSHSQVGQMVGVQRRIVRTWARRFLAQRLAGLADAPGRGAKGIFSPRGGDPGRALGLRATRDAGPEPLPLGLLRTGTPAHRGGDRRGHCRRDRATDLALAQTQALAAASLALPQEAT
jgi:hypothetical protein